MATVDLYVDTNLGTNDTSHGTSAGSGACKNLNYLIATSTKLPVNIVTSGNSYVIHCKGSTADTTAVEISNTTDATHTLTIQVDQADRHGGKWDTGKYRLEIAGAQGVYIDAGSEYCSIDGLQVKVTTSSETYAYGIRIHTATWAGVIKNCISRAVLTVDGGTGMAVGIFLTDSPGSAWNNIVYDWINGTSNDIGIEIDGAGKLYNNTVHNCYVGIDYEWTTARMLKNNLVQACGTDYTGGGTLTNCLTNLSHDTSSPNSALRSKTVVFVDSANADHALRDFHLDPTDTNAKAVGTDLTAVFTTDIDGATRRSGSAWDVGADEYVAAGASATPQLMMMGMGP